MNTPNGRQTEEFQHHLLVFPSQDNRSDIRPSNNKILAVMPCNNPMPALTQCSSKLPAVTFGNESPHSAEQYDTPQPPLQYDTLQPPLQYDTLQPPYQYGTPQYPLVVPLQDNELYRKMYPTWHVVPSRMRLYSNESGIILGCDCNDLIDVGIHYGVEDNIMLLGGPGTGKSSSILIPSLHRWNGPFFVVDIKGELASRFQKSFDNNRNIVILNPNNPNSLSVDPFEWLEIDGKRNLMSNIRDLVTILIPYGQNESDPFWTDSERAILSAALHCYYQAGLSFPQAIMRILDLSMTDLFDELDKFNDVHIRQLLGNPKSMDKKTISSIERGLRNKLEPLNNEAPLLHFFRGKREDAPVFSLTSLEDSVVFFQVPDEKVELWSAGIRLLLTMVIRHLQRRPDVHQPAEKGIPPFLFAIDELPRLGHFPIISSALSTLRSKAVNLFLVAQSISQLDAIYGKDDREVILDCCSYRVILRVDDPENQRLIADMIGTTKILSPSYNATADFNFCLTGYNCQLGERREYRIQPDELATLKDVIITSPDGVFRIYKKNPSDFGWIEKPEAEPGALSEHFCPPEKRSQDAADRVRLYLEEKSQESIDSPNSNLKGKDNANKLVKIIQGYFPDECEDGNIVELEKMIRAFAASDNLQEELRKRAENIDDN